MKDLVKRIIEIVRPYFFEEIEGFCLTIAFTLSLFATPLVSKYLIDEVIPGKSVDKLFYGLLIFLAVTISQPVVGFLKDLVFMRISEKITLDIREKLFDKILYSPLEFFEKNKSGEIISRVINDGRGVSDFITNFLVVYTKSILQIVLTISGMIFLSLRLTALIIACFTVYFIMNYLMSKRSRKMSKSSQENYDNICVNINQMTNSIIAVKSFLLEDKLKAKFRSLMIKTYDDNVKIQTMGNLLNNLTGVIVVSSLCIIYGFGSILVMQNKMTIGAVIALGLYFQTLVQPLYEIMNSNMSLNRIRPIFDRIYEYFDMQGEAEPCSKLEIEKVNSITISNLSFSYDKKRKVLDNINIKIDESGLYAFIGKSGSGKSTLAKLLLGFYRSQTGEISIGGKNVETVSLDSLRSRISYVSQDVEIFNMSIRENLVLGKSNVTDLELVAVCKRLNLHDRFTSLPEGYESIITERVNLSGGEKQRIAIARALIKKAQVFILDEPTSALDPANEGIINEMVEEISKDNIVIVIAHNISTIEKAKRTYKFERGRVSEL